MCERYRERHSKAEKEKEIEWEGWKALKASNYSQQRKKVMQFYAVGWKDSFYKKNRPVA